MSISRFTTTGCACQASRTCSLIAALLLLLLPHAVLAQQIWFGPRTPDYYVTPVRDWAALFKPTPEWSHFAAQFQVFLAAVGFFQIMSDDDLVAMAKDLQERHIGLAVGFGAIAQVPGEKCSNLEGYGRPWESEKVVTRLTRLGIQMQYVIMDGSILAGHYDPQGCQLPAAELAQRVNATLQPFTTAFPGVIVGDIEGPQALNTHAGWQDVFRAFKQDLEPLMGRKLAYLQADINWRLPDWPVAVKAMADFAHATGMQFGPIYDSDSLVSSDAEWVARAKRSFDELETEYGIIPEQADFDTWNDYPTHVFPETSPASHSYLIAQYLLPRTRFVIAASSSTLQGRLVAADGQPVADAKVVLESRGVSPTAPPPLHSVAGTVPAQARFAVLGMRVNHDCNCAGENDLLFGDFAYAEAGATGIHHNYNYQSVMRTNMLRQADGATLTKESLGGQIVLHAVIHANQDFGFDSPEFAVTPGAIFALNVPIGMIDDHALFGSVFIRFLDGGHKGIAGVPMRIDADNTAVGTATTDSSGQFVLPRPPAHDTAHRNLLLHYAGSASLRAAYSDLP